MKSVIAVIGLPTDVNSSFERGPAKAPSAIRDALWSERGNLSCSNGMEIGADIALEDHGNLSLSENAQSDDLIIRNAVAKVLGSGPIKVLA
jgi:arginase